MFHYTSGDNTSGDNTSADQRQYNTPRASGA